MKTQIINLDTGEEIIRKLNEIIQRIEIKKEEEKHEEEKSRKS